MLLVLFWFLRFVMKLVYRRMPAEQLKSRLEFLEREVNAKIRKQPDTANSRNYQKFLMLHSQIHGMLEREGVVPAKQRNELVDVAYGLLWK